MNPNIPPEMLQQGVQVLVYFVGVVAALLSYLMTVRV